MRRTLFVVEAVFGVAVLAVTTYVTVRGIAHPSVGSSIAIALLGTIGVPVALGAISIALNGLRDPDASILRREAEAKRRTAAALEDAATAETLKAEMEAFLALRARRLEIERRRTELRRDAEALVTFHKALGEAERQLDLEETQLDPATRSILDEVLDLQGERYARTLRPYLRFADQVLSLLLPASPLSLANASDGLLRRLEQRRLRRLARLAPDALADRMPSTPAQGHGISEGAED